MTSDATYDEYSDGGKCKEKEKERIKRTLVAIDLLFSSYYIHLATSWASKSLSSSILSKPTFKCGVLRAFVPFV